MRLLPEQNHVLHGSLDALEVIVNDFFLNIVVHISPQKLAVAGLSRELIVFGMALGKGAVMVCLKQFLHRAFETVGHSRLSWRHIGTVELALYLRVRSEAIALVA